MNSKIYSINEIKKRFEKVARKYEINEAYLFGSYARGEATQKSDVDFYIRADKVKGFGWGGIWAETEKAMNKKIDLISSRAIIEKEFEEGMKKDFVKIYG